MNDYDNTQQHRTRDMNREDLKRFALDYIESMDNERIDAIKKDATNEGCDIAIPVQLPDGMYGKLLYSQELNRFISIKRNPYTPLFGYKQGEQITAKL